MKMAEIEKLLGSIGEVRCDGCTICCRHQAVVLLPEEGDNLAVLKRHVQMGDALVLERTAAGDYVYLEEGGCSVWKDRPSVCRSFDCRGLFLSLSRTERRRMARKNSEVQALFDAGRERLP